MRENKRTVYLFVFEVLFAVIAVVSLFAYRPLYTAWSNMALIAVTEGAAVAASGGLAVCAVLSSRKRRSARFAAVAAVLSMLVFFLLLFGITYLFNNVLKTGEKTGNYANNLFAVNAAFVALFLYIAVWIAVFLHNMLPKAAAALGTAAAVIAVGVFGFASFREVLSFKWFYPVYRAFVSQGGVETLDKNVTYGFQYAAVKVQPTDNLSDMKNFTVRLAKNEREGCQLTVAAKKETSVRISVGQFSDGKGHTLPAVLYAESYLHIPYGSTAFSDEFPDALVESDGSTAVTIPKNENRTFFIETQSSADTPAGTYTTKVTVYCGTEVAAETEITAEVWDFTLPERSACATAVGLSGEIFELAAGLENNRYGVNTWLTFYDGSIELTDEQRAVYKAYYDYLLEHKLCANYMPYDILDSRADAYMSDPRVTAFCIPYPEDDAKLKAYWDKVNSNDEWAKKAYFYPVDEPHNAQGRVESFISRTERLSELCPGYHMVCPFDTKMITTPDGETMPVYKFEEGKVDILCPITYISEDFGEFDGWLEGRRKAGDSSWWYVCCNPDETTGYCNLFTFQNAVKHRMMFWQGFAAGYEGFLYYETCNWGYKNDPWNDPVTLFGAKNSREAGDGVLLYPGKQVGITGPVGSLRLKCVTDGIEDFDLLTLAAEYLGEEAANEYVKRVSTSFTEYTTDAAELYEVRCALGEALEKAMYK